MHQYWHRLHCAPGFLIEIQAQAFLVPKYENLGTFKSQYHLAMVRCVGKDKIKEKTYMQLTEFIVGCLGSSILGSLFLS